MLTSPNDAVAVRVQRPGFKTNLKKKSIFATSDNPEARVGFTGSGKGMTEFVARTKHNL